MRELLCSPTFVPKEMAKQRQVKEEETHKELTELSAQTLRKILNHGPQTIDI